MFLSLPNERLLFAEETGADGLPGGGGGAVVSDEGGDAGGDYDYGEEGDIDLLGGESDDELDSGESVESSGSESPDDAAVDVDSEAVAELDETESTDDVDGFDESLLNRASAIGFNFNHVKQFGSNASLKIAVEGAEQLARNILEQQRSGASQSSQSGQAPGVSSQMAKARQIHATQAEKIKVLADEGYGDEAVAIMSQQNDMALEQATIIDSLQQQSQHAQYTASIASQQEAELQFERSLDGYLESLGDDYSSLFGKGASATMKQGTQELANRARVFQLAGAMQETAQQKGWEVPSDSRAFEMAVNAEFGNRSKEIARKEVKSQLRKSSRSTTARPSQSVGQSLTGVERATSRVNDFFKAHAGSGDASDSFDDDEI